MGSWVGVKLLCHFLTSPAKTADLILKQIKQDVGCFLKKSGIKQNQMCSSHRFSRA